MLPVAPPGTYPTPSDNDQIDGGGGNDTVTYHAASAAVTVDLFNLYGYGVATGGGGYDSLTNVENVVGQRL